MPPKKKLCTHPQLVLTPSPNAALKGYNQPAPATAQKAATFRTPINGTPPSITTFPGPLVLPYDDLSHDPKYPPQSLTAFKRGIHRNQVTGRRNKLYYLTLPVRSAEVEDYQSWITPVDITTKALNQTASPDWDDVVSYLSAFFHPLQVLPYPSVTTISKWSASGKTPHLAISSSSSNLATRLRYRKAPEGDEACYTHQLNLCDLLDFAIDILPEDAYSLIILTGHDLFEDADDDFCIGRAFGGSRVCVVSSARYHPYSEQLAGVGAEWTGGKGHDWPGSHCATFVETLCDDELDDAEIEKRNKTKKAKANNNAHGMENTPMYRAMIAHRDENKSAQVRHREHNRSIWVSRVCKTAAHELLHCFGLDHCVYYACSMQGTASTREDTRQPFYLCPVDQAKLKDALSGYDKAIGEMGASQWEVEWCRRMKRCCEEIAGKPFAMGWRPFIAWLEARIDEVQLEMQEGQVGSVENPIELD
ncbi:hypothetical protein H072_11103 [Dactylellina haptotyla CBS 200.50]|uniref:Uncharacterized protein n=1 Tax=Dactylellina haptotyla (strain CBS 200.50) TaxID=1284197 RepID=S7ZYP6_DACHA|nr:hypothetical protein H072_11103 [Dactylellina haptotyla CBS 200.50]